MKRRDITLGEMQDACNRAKWFCTECDMRFVCPTNLHEAPQALDLTDPPRFTEAQMALLRGLYAVGGVSLIQSNGTTSLNDKHGYSMWFGEILGLKGCETLDLAELIGKDGESK